MDVFELVRGEIEVLPSPAPPDRVVISAIFVEGPFGPRRHVPTIGRMRI